MEIPNSKQQQLTFDKGITNVPSDAICSDNTLEECIGLTYDNGEHRVIQRPASFITNYAGTIGGATMTSMPKVLFIHHIGSQKNYIVRAAFSAYHSNANVLCWGTVANKTLTVQGSSLGDYDESVSITAIGKTLVVKNNSSISYFLWNGTGYTALGDRLPEVELEFTLEALAFDYPMMTRLDHGDCISFSGDYPSVMNQEDYNNLVLGLYAKNKKSIYLQGGFVNPFYIRYALELYDGSYTHQSAPVLMFPSVRCNSRAVFTSLEVAKDVTLYTYYSFLKYRWADNTVDLAPWSDIIKDVVVFVSDEVDVYDLAGDQTPAVYKVDGTKKVWHDGVYGTNWASDYRTKNNYDEVDTSTDFLPLTQMKENALLEQLKSVSNFYKAFSVGVIPSSGSASARIAKYTLENITTQERLPDDYYSHSPLSASSLYAYNNRLLLADVKRGYYKGAAFMMPYRLASSSNWIIDVLIKTSSGDKTVRRSVTTNEYIGKYYFFYPDPKAYEVRLYRGGVMVETFPLEPHSFLNGAFALRSLPSGNPVPPSGSGSVPIVNEPTPEFFANQIWTSEINNPFLFKAEGNITVGNGEIIGISSQTHALSQGQFGQYPLIIFTTEGISAASVGTTGLFMAIHPMSREVAFRDNPCITQTDGAIFFASEKGLMVVIGNQVKCVSEQLSGLVPVGVANWSEPFEDFLKQAFIAYDYRDSLLWIFRKTVGGNAGSATCWVYNMKSGTFSHYTFASAITHVVNAYPDYLLQDSDTVYSLIERPNINSSEERNNSYTAQMITRPMKLENALALKTIQQILHIKQMEGVLALRIFASNNLKTAANTWVEMHSLMGTPWKYYKLQYDFTNLKATDRFAGSVIVTEERRTNKLR